MATDNINHKSEKLREDDSHLTLPPLLDEFRTALQDEIDVAKRSALSNAIPLSNGHKIAEQGGAHQYAFLIDSVLNTPDGAPGDLIVSGKAPLSATIVSAEGLRILISIETDLGKFVPTASLQTNLTILMRKLIERIENNAKAENPAANRMLGSTPVTGNSTTVNDNLKLNKNQLYALQSALGRDLTVIWGPPGTGKTYTIGTIAEYLNKDSRSVLLVSHTNIAVDQAIKHVANSMKEQLEEGVVLRLGEVRDEILRSDFPDVLIETQVERQSRELIQQREELLKQKELLVEEMTTTQRSIAILEWIEPAKQDIELVETTIREIKNLGQQEQDATIELTEISNQHSRLLELYKSTEKVIELRKLLVSKRKKESGIQTELNACSAERKQLSKIIAQQDVRIKIATRIESLRNELSTYPSPTEQKENISRLSRQLVETKEKLKFTKSELNKATDLLSETLNVGTIRRIFSGLPKPDEQQIVVKGLTSQAASLELEVKAIEKAHNSMTAKLARIIEIDSEILRHKNIGTITQEIQLKNESDQELKQISTKIIKLEESLTILKSQILKIENKEQQISKTFEGDAEDTHLEVCAKLKKYKELQQSVKSFRSKIIQLQKKVSSLIFNLTSTILQWKILEKIPLEPARCLDLIIIVHSELSAEYEQVDLDSLSEIVKSLESEIRLLDSQINDINAKLALVECEVINKASVIGATLTKTYLSDDIQGRKFDTVVLDEASMAPIPALWTAALLAEKNLIIVGDFKQLPPIVLSNNELTKKWLGRDIFEVSGLEQKYILRDSPAHFITLTEQRRMLPEIAQIANLFYDKNLENKYISAEEYPEYQMFIEWYIKGWSHDNPVVLVDTEPLHAWVTSVVRHTNTSRLNFLSATVAVDLADQLLSTNRQKRREGEPNRVLIISPYRAHAKLVKLLLKDLPNLQDEVISGTAHSFQGSEADVVIFDLVADEPHFRVNLFMPSLDDQIKRLLNVALTRPKFRLFIMGDFNYCRKLGKKAFLGKTLIPFLFQYFPIVDAKCIVPDGLAARAAKTQMTMLGGKIDPDADRIVVTQNDFYRLLSGDLENSQNRIIIYSPYITSDRVSYLLPQFQSAIERGTNIYLITKTPSERSKSDLSTIKKIEKQLSEIGIIIIHKLRMHEKLIFIDEDITWSGSLNPLSFSNTQEIMERRKSKNVLNDYFQILRLKELLETQKTPESKCPICTAEMIAAEGADQPYYWRCINEKCYTRSIDQPYPFDGVLKCGNCNSSVEYGYWGDYPHWRCSKNNRHRQRIFKSHLRLPKMLAKIPNSERKELSRIFQITNLEEYVISSNPTSRTIPQQRNLFD